MCGQKHKQIMNKKARYKSILFTLVMIPLITLFNSYGAKAQKTKSALQTEINQFWPDNKAL